MEFTVLYWQFGLKSPNFSMDSLFFIGPPQDQLQDILDRISQKAEKSNIVNPKLNDENSQKPPNNEFNAQD